MKITDINKIEDATKAGRGELFRLGTAILFIVGIMIFLNTVVTPVSGSHTLLVAAAMIGGYMALNIGANDVANNVGPAVGSKAVSLFGAIIIAAIFESAGALLGGGEVVSTIKKGIINPEGFQTDTFIWLMMGALLSAAIWLNVATALGAPVSTTHSIVGGVLGAGIAAGGVGIANWGKMGAIAASWVISPVLGGIIAALFLYLIKTTITYKADPLAASKKVVPYLLALMGWSFSTYLILKGLKKLWEIDFLIAALYGLIFAVIVFLLARPIVAKAAKKLVSNKDSVNQLFTVPLIFAAALLSFAHGANDVANAVGPLAAINDAIMQGTVSGKAEIPMWVMMVGAIGISLGLALFGPKLIKTVGTEITELNKIRAFSVAMAASITVIIASQLGLPVSSTHIAVGGIFGVGFLREYLKTRYGKTIEDIKHHHEDDAHPEDVEKFLEDFKSSDLERKKELLDKLKAHSTKAHLSKKERKALGKIYQQKLVKRSHLLKIAAAWVITVPASALLSAIIYFTIRGIMLEVPPVVP